MSDAIHRTSARKLGFVTWLGLAVVALAAAVLSFAALRRLAVLSGTPAHLAWLFPITLDATMMVATRLWVSVDVPDRAWRFARVVALSTIAGSVVGNAGLHALTGGGAWWPVVVGAVPAAVLAAMAHLVALAVQQPERPAVPQATVTIEPPAPEPRQEAGEGHQEVATPPPPSPGEVVERARELVEAGEAEGVPVGRKRLARELGTTEHQARQLLAQLDTERRPALHAVGGGSR